MNRSMDDDPNASGPLVRAPRYELLDVWRGVACLMVLLHHAGFAIILRPDLSWEYEGGVRSLLVRLFWGMNLGVPLFFVISGYCIAASSDTARLRGWGSLHFLRRRFWRIYPPYWAALLLFVAVAAGLDSAGLHRLHFARSGFALQIHSPGKLGPVQWLGNLTLTEGWRSLVWPKPLPEIYTRVAWSLCYEEQFYFLCFLMLWLARGRLYGAWALATVAIVGWRAICVDTGRSDLLEGSFFVLWPEFAVGMAVYWALHAAPSAFARRAVALVIAALAVRSWFWAPGLAPVPKSTPTAAAFGLLLMALHPFDARARGLAWLKPLRACGQRSYSIYLVHLPVCTVGNIWLAEQGLTGFWPCLLVMVPVVSAASLGASWIFYHHVERHFLRCTPPVRRPVIPVSPVPLGESRMSLP